MTLAIDNTTQFTDLSPAKLIEESISRSEGRLTDTGALLVTTGKRTGRSPADRFIVREASTEESIDWGPVNRPFDADKFDALWERVECHLSGKDRFVNHLHVGEHIEHYLPVRAVTETAWQGLFGRNMFIRPPTYNPKSKPEWTIYNAEGSNALIIDELHSPLGSFICHRLWN